MQGGEKVSEKGERDENMIRIRCVMRRWPGLFRCGRCHWPAYIIIYIGLVASLPPLGRRSGRAGKVNPFFDF